MSSTDLQMYGEVYRSNKVAQINVRRDTYMQQKGRLDSHSPTFTSITRAMTRVISVSRLRIYILTM